MNAVEALRLAERAQKTRAKAWVRYTLKDIEEAANKGEKALCAKVKENMDITLAFNLLRDEGYEVRLNRSGTGNTAYVASFHISWSFEGQK